jgi:PEGA domain
MIRNHKFLAALLAAALMVTAPCSSDARGGGGGGGGMGGGHGGGMGGGHGGGWGHGGWGGWGGGWHGNHFFFGPRFVVGGGFLYGSPFYWGPNYWGYPYYGYGYYPWGYGPYGYPPYGYPPYDANVPSYPGYPPPTAQGAPDQSAIPPAADTAPPPDQGYLADSPDAAGDDYSSYGLIQLRGVPDAASVDLDGRHWLDGRNLGGRWLALPAGLHTISVRAEGYETVEQRVDVTAGRNQVVRIGPLRLRSG